MRALVGLFDALWFLMALLWFVGVYWAEPSLANFGKIGSFTVLGIILISLALMWIMLWSTRLSKNAPPGYPGTIALGPTAPMPAK